MESIYEGKINCPEYDAGRTGRYPWKRTYYAVKKQSDGLVHADYCNSSQEDAALKLTLTALDPHAEFVIHVQRQEPYKLRANAAGIFESRFLVPAGRRIDIDEEKKEKK